MKLRHTTILAAFVVTVVGLTAARGQTSENDAVKTRVEEPMVFGANAESQCEPGHEDAVRVAVAVRQQVRHAVSERVVARVTTERRVR